MLIKRFFICNFSCINCCFYLSHRPKSPNFVRYTLYIIKSWMDHLRFKIIFALKAMKLHEPIEFVIELQNTNTQVLNIFVRKIHHAVSHARTESVLTAWLFASSPRLHTPRRKRTRIFYGVSNPALQYRPRVLSEKAMRRDAPGNRQSTRLWRQVLFLLPRWEHITGVPTAQLQPPPLPQPSLTPYSSFATTKKI